eukprot:2671304-Rhodomonas_salina.2
MPASPDCSRRRLLPDTALAWFIGSPSSGISNAANDCPSLIVRETVVGGHASVHTPRNLDAELPCRVSCTSGILLNPGSVTKTVSNGAMGIVRLNIIVIVLGFPARIGEKVNAGVPFNAPNDWKRTSTTTYELEFDTCIWIFVISMLIPAGGIEIDASVPITTLTGSNPEISRAVRRETDTPLRLAV